MPNFIQIGLVVADIRTNIHTCAHKLCESLFAHVFHNISRLLVGAYQIIILSQCKVYASLLDYWKKYNNLLMQNFYNSSLKTNKNSNFDMFIYSLRTELC